MDISRNCIFALLCAIITCGAFSKESNDLSDTENELQPQHREKRFIGAIAGVVAGGLSIAGMVMSRKSAEAAARRHDETMRMHLTQLCTAICVTEWSQWSSCSHRCAGGSRTRSREEQSLGMCSDLSDFTCPYRTSETGPCNSECPNAGSAVSPGRCTCLPEWTGNCCQQEVRCEYPGSPENGRVSGTWPARYQAVATFTCNPGFTLIGQSESSCQTSGQWTSRTPTCTRIICPRPDVQPRVNILNEGDEFYVGDEVVYTCEEGYRLVGLETRECRPGNGASGRWSGFSPTCTRVTCGDPGIPLHGERIGDGILFNDVLRFSCEEGYRLVGSDRLQCTASGHWLGIFPQCEEILCEEPFVPENGVMLLRTPVYGAVASFQCNEGYRLEGSHEIECIGDGEWSSEEPTCQAADCGQPNEIQNGAKDGSIYYYPHIVTFSCFHGYVLVGESQIECLANGGWSSVTPSCEPCALGDFMDESQPGVCQRCPEHTLTTTPASTSQEQCICVEGYDGPPGGPCTEIQCPVLVDPEHGSIQGECENTMNQECQFACDDGYYISRGSSVRTCQSNGEWDGVNTTCTACGKNTYKSSEQSCLPCPIHSHTLYRASMRDDCICDDGYAAAGNGSCEDVNECIANDGRGPCSDLCDNNEGGYSCQCSISGYEIHAEDPHTCIIVDQCRNLTQNEAPENGGLVCHWYVRENSQHCTARCNPGYEFPTRINDYESCGPTTNYTWSFRSVDSTAVFEPCIEEFFPDFTLEAESLYFVRACDELTSTEKEDIYREFAERLQANGICRKNNRQVCNLSHMNVICGVRTEDASGRYRRDTNDEQAAGLGYGVKALKLEHRISDCGQICRFLRIPSRFCTQLCVPTYKRFMKASVMYAKRQLQRLYGSDQVVSDLEFTAASRTFTPARDGLRTGQVEGHCPAGMGVTADNCVTCGEGMFVNGTTGRCQYCPVGTYQPLEAQNVCIPCPVGTTTSSTGSTICQVCPQSHYGEQCSEPCLCVNGSCDPRDGACACHSGWEGPLCDTDVNGCNEGVCIQGLNCLDIPAPGTGFQCVTQ